MDAFGYWSLFLLINFTLVLGVFIVLCCTTFQNENASSNSSFKLNPSSEQQDENLVESIPILTDIPSTNGKLESLVYSDRTDKNTTHSYLPVYGALFEPFQTTALHVAEIGICNGGSIQLWHDYFPNASIYGIDIMPREQVWAELHQHPRIFIHAETDAYDENWVRCTLGYRKFDIIIDDGSHLLPHMQKCLQYYLPLLREGGLLIIEDIPDMSWIPLLAAFVPRELQSHLKVYDLRKNKNRFDDILFVLQK